MIILSIKTLELFCRSQSSVKIHRALFKKAAYARPRAGCRSVRADVVYISLHSSNSMWGGPRKSQYLRRKNKTKRDPR